MLTTTELHELIDKLNAEGCDYNVYDKTPSWERETHICISSANYFTTLWAKKENNEGYKCFYLNSVFNSNSISIDEVYDYLKNEFFTKKANRERNMAIRQNESDIVKTLDAKENAVRTKEILMETEKAFALYNQYNKIVWLPKSLTKIINTDYGTFYIVAPQWLVNKNKLERFTLK